MGEVTMLILQLGQKLKDPLRLDARFFKPLPVEVVKAVELQLETVNKNLQAYYDAWDKFIKSWIVIMIKDPNCVYQWRLQVVLSKFSGRDCHEGGRQPWNV